MNKVPDKFNKGVFTLFLFHNLTQSSSAHSHPYSAIFIVIASILLFFCLMQYSQLSPIISFSFFKHPYRWQISSSTHVPKLEVLRHLDTRKQLERPC